MPVLPFFAILQHVLLKGRAESMQCASYLKIYTATMVRCIILSNGGWQWLDGWDGCDLCDLCCVMNLRFLWFLCELVPHPSSARKPQPSLLQVLVGMQKPLLDHPARANMEDVEDSGPGQILRSAIFHVFHALNVSNTSVEVGA